MIDFANGAIGTVLMTFDVWRAGLPRMEIYGSEGTLRIPDPNNFGGAVELWRHDAREWRTMPLINNMTANLRGFGVADMARAIREGRSHRANGELAYHVLEIMHAAHDASREERHINLVSTCERPAPLRADEFEFAQSSVIILTSRGSLRKNFVEALVPSAYEFAEGLSTNRPSSWAKIASLPNASSSERFCFAFGRLLGVFTVAQATNSHIIRIRNDKFAHFHLGTAGSKFAHQHLGEVNGKCLDQAPGT